jgi:uncharacterized protein (TIGR02452 family)
MNKDELIQVYQNTKEICLNIPKPDSAKYINVDNTGEKHLYTRDGNVIVEPMDTVSALIKYSNSINTKGYQKSTAILNNASSKRKGGGVESGSQAQEECLFRCSNLFNIPDSFYPILQKEFVYTRGASFVKNSDYGIIFPIESDVITMPAINLNRFHVDNTENKDSIDNYEIVMLEKIEKMFDIAAYHLCDNIILSAWGCGVFKNDPTIVAGFFNKVIEKKRMLFDNIIFAVINDTNSVANNYKIFSEIIKTH